MSEHKITVEGGSSVRLPTSGKYCDRDIIVTAQGGGTELPALTSPAAESDVVKGKEFIDASGVKKTGTVEEVDGAVFMDNCAEFSPDGDYMVAVGTFPSGNGKLIRGDSAVIVPVPGDWLGDATPEDVVAGKTFTSAYGVKRAGTAQLGVTLPVLSDPAGENDVREGKEYIDADGALRDGRLKMDGVFTPDWGTYVPVEVQYDSDDRYLVMKNTDGIGGGLETVNVTFTIYGEGTVYYMGSDGNMATLTNPYEETVAVVKNNPVIVWYQKYDGTYLILRDLSGGSVLDDSAAAVNGHSVSVLLFQEDGNVLYEEA